MTKRRRPTLAVILAAVTLAACRTADPVPSPPRQSGPEPWFPSTEALLADPSGTTMESSTVLLVTRGTSVVTIRDEKRVTHCGNGDFSLNTRCVHQGSEAGDTVESFQAVRRGRDYWTRGSGGPWVYWDDPLHEPRTTLLGTAGESGDLLELLAPCARVEPTPKGQVLTLSGDGCRVESRPGDAPLKGIVIELDGRVDRTGAEVASVELKAGMEAEAAGHVARIEITHEMRRTIEVVAAIEPPENVISSRRRRPVKMVKSVLSGLVEKWGPGAPSVLQGK